LFFFWKSYFYTRACFDEQKTAYWILFDILVAEGDTEDITPLPGNTDDELTSWDWEKLSVGRLDFVSMLIK
jgi:hypothetical protein